MHLLSKHKFYASAEKLFYEFFKIVNLSDNKTITADVPLATLVAAALNTASSSPSNTNNSSNTSLIKNEISSPSKASTDTEKITTLKRALIDANIIIPTSNLNINTQKVSNTVHINSVKKMKYVVDDAAKADAVQNRAKMHVQYDTEVLDDGNTIYICCKCKLVFLKTELLAEHKCMLNDELDCELQHSQNLSINSSNGTFLGELNDSDIAKDDLNAVTVVVAKKSDVNTSTSCDDFDIMKNASDVIYIE